MEVNLRGNFVMFQDFMCKTRTHIAGIVILSLFFILLSACTSMVSKNNQQIKDDDLLLSETASLALNMDLSEDELAKDIDLLVYALKFGYGGRKYIDQSAFKAALQKLNELKNRANIIATSEHLKDEIDNILLDMPDNHIHARHSQLGLSKKRDRLLRKGSVGPNVLPKKNNMVWRLSYRKIGKGSIPVLAIVSLPSVHDAAWTGFKREVEQALPSASALIIDLRGNTGGSDVMPQWLASRLTGKTLNSPYDKVVKSQSPATLALAANMQTLKIINYLHRNEKVPQYLVESKQKWLDLSKKAKNGIIPAETTYSLSFDSNSSGVSFRNPIYILIDSECASSCESFLEFLEMEPHIKTVGENSGGFLNFGNMGAVILPHSKIIVQLATDYWTYKDGRSLEKIGYAPKIRVPSGEDALDYALTEIKRELKKK